MARTHELVAAIEATDVAQEDMHGWTAPMTTSKQGQLECVCALLGARDDVLHTDRFGWTALMSANSQGNVECVRALLEADSDHAQATKGRWTALMIASSRGHVECVRALLEAGADVSHACEHGCEQQGPCRMHACAPRGWRSCRAGSYEWLDGVDGCEH
jgi:ankyrin repeat protein